MFPNELEIKQRHKDLQREAENHHLVRFVCEGRPSLVERIAARLSAIPLRSANIELEAAAQPTEAIA